MATEVLVNPLPGVETDVLLVGRLGWLVGWLGGLIGWLAGWLAQVCAWLAG